MQTGKGHLAARVAEPAGVIDDDLGDDDHRAVCRGSRCSGAFGGRGGPWRRVEGGG
jgi:hypothetical protein